MLNGINLNYTELLENNKDELQRLEASNMEILNYPEEILPLDDDEDLIPKNLKKEDLKSLFQNFISGHVTFLDVWWIPNIFCEKICI